MLIHLWDCLKWFFQHIVINRPVKITSNNVSAYSSLFRQTYSIFENEKYHIALGISASTRRLLVQFSHSKKLRVTGDGIDIIALFYHQDLDKWLKETIERFLYKIKMTSTGAIT